MEFKHVSVLLKETLEFLSPQKGDFFVDCTLGGGGHSKEILERIGNKGFLVGIDQDSDALKAAEANLSKFKNKKLVKANFSEIDKVVSKLQTSKVNGILADLGTSSYQFDEPMRGFSYKFLDAILDMRMDKPHFTKVLRDKQELTAEKLVNEYEQKNLEQIIREYGEEKNARKIAELIVKARPIRTVGELLGAITLAFSPKERFAKKEPVWASSVFRALRMEVNNEVATLKTFLEKAPKLLAKNSRLAIITFHSIEDRIVKHAFQELAKPLEVDQITGQILKKSPFKIITKKPIVPTQEEIQSNSRAKSAKLRVIERVDSS